MPTKFCIQNIYKSLSKCGICLIQKHVLYILYTKVCSNMRYIFTQTFCIYFVYILYGKCIQKFVEMSDTFCIHFGIHFVYIAYISSDAKELYIINVMYTIYIQNSYRMYIQIIVYRMNLFFPHILTRLFCTS